MTRPVLVLLPGVLNTHLLWHHQVEVLSPHMEIVIPELYHESSVSLLAGRVISELDEKGYDKFFLGGLSMGGYVACEVMRQAGERVEKLVLMNTSLRADNPMQTAMRRNLVKQSYIKGFKGVTPRILPSIISHYSLEDEGVTSCVLEMAESFTGENFRNQQEAIIARPDSREFAKEHIKCPMLAIGGEDDEVTPVFLQAEMKRLIKGCDFEILPKCGHLSALEQGERVSSLMRSFFVGD